MAQALVRGMICGKLAMSTFAGAAFATGAIEQRGFWTNASRQHSHLHPRKQSKHGCSGGYILYPKLCWGLFAEFGKLDLVESRSRFKLWLKLACLLLLLLCLCFLHRAVPVFFVFCTALTFPLLRRRYVLAKGLNR
jgi:hypothetical protein